MTSKIRVFKIMLSALQKEQKTAKQFGKPKLISAVRLVVLAFLSRRAARAAAYQEQRSFGEAVKVTGMQGGASEFELFMSAFERLDERLTAAGGKAMEEALSGLKEERPEVAKAILSDVSGRLEGLIEASGTNDLSPLQVAAFAAAANAVVRSIDLNDVAERARMRIFEWLFLIVLWDAPEGQEILTRMLDELDNDASFAERLLDQEEVAERMPMPPDLGKPPPKA